MEFFIFFLFGGITVLGLRLQFLYLIWPPCYFSTLNSNTNALVAIGNRDSFAHFPSQHQCLLLLGMSLRSNARIIG